MLRACTFFHSQIKLVKYPCIKIYCLYFIQPKLCREFLTFYLILRLVGVGVNQYIMFIFKLYFEKFHCLLFQLRAQMACVLSESR